MRGTSSMSCTCWFTQREALCSREHALLVPVSENALRSVPGVMYWAAWQEQVGPHALRHAISAYVDAHNDEGKPFKWTKTADEILAKVKRSTAHRSSPRCPR